MKLLREILFPLIAVLAAFVVGGIVVWIIGDSPFQTYKLLIGSAFSWPDGIGYTLFNATPLIFTGLAVAVAFCRGLGWIQVRRAGSGQYCDHPVLSPANDCFAAALLPGGNSRRRDLGRYPR